MAGRERTIEHSPLEPERQPESATLLAAADA